jgi:hypothetical protein
MRGSFPSIDSYLAVSCGLPVFCHRLVLQQMVRFTDRKRIETKVLGPDERPLVDIRFETIGKYNA